jgi:predicted RNase H-like HicB family nuclease
MRREEPPVGRGENRDRRIVPPGTTPVGYSLARFRPAAFGGRLPATVSQAIYNGKRGYTPMARQFDVVIERDSEGYYVASVPQIPACHTQARSLDEVTERIREAIELCLEVEGTPEQDLEFIGIQRVTIAA